MFCCSSSQRTQVDSVWLDVGKCRSMVDPAGLCRGLFSFPGCETVFAGFSVTPAPSQGAQELCRTFHGITQTPAPSTEGSDGVSTEQCGPCSLPGARGALLGCARVHILSQLQISPRSAWPTGAPAPPKMEPSMGSISLWQISGDSAPSHGSASLSAGQMIPPSSWGTLGLLPSLGFMQAHS